MCITTGLYNNGTGFGYPDCQAAVNTTLVNNAVPVQLPNLLPTLTNTLTCADYGLPSSHSLCNFYSNWIGFNQTICMTYVSNHMGVCYTYYDPWYNYGYPQGFYSVEGYQQMNDYILWAVANNYSTSTGVRYRLFESATQALVALPILMSDNITSYYACYCFCTTNLCNTNMSTCTAGFSFNCTYSPIIGTTTSLATSTPTINTIVSTTGVTSASTTIFSNVTISVMNNSTLIVSTTTINSTLSSSTNNATAVSSTTSGFSVSNNLTSSTLGTTGTTASAAANDATTIGLAIGIGVSGLLILALTVGLIASALNRRCKKKPSSTNKVEPEKVKSDDTNEQTMFHQQAETPKQSDPPPQPLQPVRQAIRTNRTADLRMAAWSDA